MGCAASHQGQAGDAGLLRPWNLGRELGVRKNRSKSREQLMDQVAMALGVYREGGYDASLWWHFCGSLFGSVVTWSPVV